MNKKLIALAVAGACVAPAAMAQTANPVTLYGRVYATFESVEADGGSAAAVARRNRVSDQASLLGVRGTEDLGGGLKAFFQLESSFKPDENNSTFAARNSGVGLQGGWGSFMIGRWDMPFKVTTIAVDPFGDLTLAGITGVLNDGGNFDRRDQNVVQYWSPSFAGFAVRAAFTANEGKTATLNPSDTGASLTYTGGPVYVVLAWEEHKDPSATMQKEEGMALGGTVSFGPVKLGALYEEFKRHMAPGTAGRNKQKSWMGNISYTIGNNVLIYQHMDSKDGGTSGAAQPKCNSDSLGYQYNFSRRTFFLASYTRVDNNDAGSCNFGANRLTIANGQDPRGVSLGLRHVF